MMKDATAIDALHRQGASGASPPPRWSTGQPDPASCSNGTQIARNAARDTARRKVDANPVTIRNINMTSQSSASHDTVPRQCATATTFFAVTADVRA